MKKDKNTKRYKKERQKDKKEFNNVMFNTAVIRQFHTLTMFLRKCIHGTIAWEKGNFAINATLHF